MKKEDKKRDYINEIIDIKTRTDRNSRYEYRRRLDDIESIFEGNCNDELLKYIPISTVACFEAYFRSVYRELIDFGDPFSSNATNFNQSKNVKFDFDIVNAIRTKTVTVGEFISHILPCNNFDDISSNLSVLTDKKFLDEIKPFKKESIFEWTNESSAIFTANNDQIIKDIKRTFELRHIFCHEFATNLKIDKEEIRRCYENSKIFLDHVNSYIGDLLYPNAPETQTDMNIRASEDFQVAEGELSQLILKIKDACAVTEEDLRIDNKMFDDTIIQWKKYRELQAKLDAHVCKGGTMYPLLYASSMMNTTEEKIESLNNKYDYALRKYKS